ARVAAADCRRRRHAPDRLADRTVRRRGSTRAPVAQQHRPRTSGCGMMPVLSALLSGAATIATMVSIGFLVIVAAAAVAGALARGGRRERAADAYQAIAASRFTIPVSLIVPAGKSASVSDTISSLLALNYPEFEVVVV